MAALCIRLPTHTKPRWESNIRTCSYFYTCTVMYSSTRVRTQNEMTLFTALMARDSEHPCGGVAINNERRTPNRSQGDARVACIRLPLPTIDGIQRHSRQPEASYARRALLFFVCVFCFLDFTCFIVPARLSSAELRVGAPPHTAYLARSLRL